MGGTNSVLAEEFAKIREFWSRRRWNFYQDMGVISNGF